MRFYEKNLNVLKRPILPYDKQWQRQRQQASTHQTLQGRKGCSVLPAQTAWFTAHGYHLGNLHVKFPDRITSKTLKTGRFALLAWR